MRGRRAVLQRRDPHVRRLAHWSGLKPDAEEYVVGNVVPRGSLPPAAPMKFIAPLWNSGPEKSVRRIWPNAIWSSIQPEAWTRETPFTVATLYLKNRRGGVE